MWRICGHQQRMYIPLRNLMLCCWSVNNSYREQHLLVMKSCLSNRQALVLLYGALIILFVYSLLIPSSFSPFPPSVLDNNLTYWDVTAVNIWPTSDSALVIYNFLCPLIYDCGWFPYESNSIFRDIPQRNCSRFHWVLFSLVLIPWFAWFISVVWNLLLLLLFCHQYIELVFVSERKVINYIRYGIQIYIKISI